MVSTWYVYLGSLFSLANNVYRRYFESVIVEVQAHKFSVSFVRLIFQLHSSTARIHHLHLVTKIVAVLVLSRDHLPIKINIPAVVVLNDFKAPDVRTRWILWHWKQQLIITNLALKKTYANHVKT